MRKTRKHRNYKKHRNHKKRHYTKRHNKHSYTRRKKHREFSIIPGSKSVPMFAAPNKKNSEVIIVSVEQEPTGNIIPGLRNYIKNM